MKKIASVMVILLAVTLTCFLAGCGNNSADANIFVEVPQDQVVTWHTQTLPADCPAYNPPAYCINHFEGPYLAILTDFNTYSDQHPSLDQEKGSLEQTLSFTLITGASWDTEPEVVVKANGEILSHTSAEKSTQQINLRTETVDGEDIEIYDEVEVWSFTYQQDGYTADVTLTFEGLLAIV